MLGQLVCIDRRYQRMNCFNIREVQALLKRKFFVDLLNTHDYKTLISKSMISVKYKSLGDSFDLTNTSNFFNFGLENLHSTRKTIYLALDKKEVVIKLTMFQKAIDVCYEAMPTLLLNRITYKGEPLPY